MNAALCGNTQSQFVTAGFLYLDEQRGVVRYAAAAHPVLLRLRGQEVTTIEENGLMLAAFPFANYMAIESDLQLGDRFVMYTDGLLEAAGARDEFFGTARLSDQILRTRDNDSEEAADLIMSTVRRWALRQDDDLTLVVCDYKR